MNFNENSKSSIASTQGETRNQGASKINFAAAPSITLPKGGGAIKGIGEKFTMNPVTGTGAFSVPIYTSPGRSGFGPQLSLSYDSGAGNGPFGMGWSLSLPEIRRKTEKGLPKYQDADESDVFILSGAEDLVPVLEDDGALRRGSGRLDGNDYTILYYRPRIEGLFARIERWTQADDPQSILWRSISRENITTWYGKTQASRISDPNDPSRIFSWLICESYDDKGNATIYEYVPEDSNQILLSQVHERNRNPEIRQANRYLKRVKYGNQTSRLVQPDLQQMNWLFEVVFDYDEGCFREIPETELTAPEKGFQYVEVTPYKVKQREDEPQDWPVRPDPFSSYRAGFEVRTYRLCHRVLMFHHFPAELHRDDYLVRSTEFTYCLTPTASFITSVTQSGFVHHQENIYLKKSLPPLEFSYSEAKVNETIGVLDRESLINLPEGLDGARYQFVDLDGEGIAGILTEQAGVWFYKPNLGEGEFGPLQAVKSKPPSGALNGGQQLLDLAGDGQLDLVDFNRPAPGFYERTQERNWNPFTPFLSLPNLNWNDPNLKFTDLTGDGHADLLITEDEVMTWYPSLAESGFGRAVKVPQPRDEEEGPRLVFADGTQSIYLADFSGDGLTDLVRIRNGEVCYWPNLGYGRFGKKVTMDNSPRFESPDLFDQGRIRMADIDGSGVTDIIYLSGDGVKLYFNQSGNSWSQAETIQSLPMINNLSSVQVADLFGNGTACLIWSSTLPDDKSIPFRYIKLMGDTKPHLLNRVINNLGAETRVFYTSSTKFYLEDKKAGRPWITRLPFPVQVVERVETYDWISRNLFVNRFAYHHGYFDGVEREFRGFGLVEKWDTEEFAALKQNNHHRFETKIDASSHVPPVLTRTWFHTGAYFDHKHISDFFAGLSDENDEGEYYREPGLTAAQARDLLLEDTIIPGGLTAEDEREACRALKGSMLRQEIYGLDGTTKEKHPYTVTEQNFVLRCLQKKGANRHPVFLTHSHESLIYHYERNPADPRLSHSLSLEVDRFGNPCKTVAITYGRRSPDPELAMEDQLQQGRIRITYSENQYTNSIDTKDNYFTPAPCETRTYELTGFSTTGAAGRFQAADFGKPDPNEFSRWVLNFDNEIKYEEKPTGGKQRRLIEQIRVLYRPDDLGASRNDPLALLPLGEIEALSLPGETYKLAFTPGLLDQVFQRKRDGQPDENLLPNPSQVFPVDSQQDQASARGGYVADDDGQWWLPSGRVFYSPGAGDGPSHELAWARAGFFLPRRFRDPFHTVSNPTETLVSYDDYCLLVQETCDALGNLVTAGERDLDPALPLVRQGQDYRVLQPFLVMDPNRNRTEVAYNALGMVVGFAVMGKPGENLGDTLTGFWPDLSPTQVGAFLIDPRGTIAREILGGATSRIVYDFHCYFNTQEPHYPPYTATITRETHVSDLKPGQETVCLVSFSYFDGFGREIQKKFPAEKGPVPKRDETGRILIHKGQPELTDYEADKRWVGSGWTIYNNKGKPVRQYEPFFTDTHFYEFDLQIGVSPILFYDPAERVIAKLNPNHTWEKIVFDPWRQASWDRNDTVFQDDPTTDPDVGGFFARLDEAEYLPTWYSLRINPTYATTFESVFLDPKTRDAEVKVARKTAHHAGTPAMIYYDSLGRTFLTLSDNGLDEDGNPQKYGNRANMDIKGEQLEVIDPKNRIVMRYDHNLAGNLIHQSGMETGERWILEDISGNPIRSWDNRGHSFKVEYDPLRRPVRFHVKGASLSTPDTWICYEKIEYGEGQSEDLRLNLRTRIFKAYDGAGVITNEAFNPVTRQTEAYDFKGNLLRTQRRLAKEYRSAPNWDGETELEPEIYASGTAFDALNRPVQVIPPYPMTGEKVAVIQPVYNEANLLQAIDIWLKHSSEPGKLLIPQTEEPSLRPVKNINYNAKGDRSLVEYGNGAWTEYEYDPLTYRLTHLTTFRGKFDSTGCVPQWDPRTCQEPPIICPQLIKNRCALQDLRYTYDPMGNITKIRDDAQPVIYFKNAVVKPEYEYVYNAIYRLVAASGREHRGDPNQAPTTWNDEYRVNLDHPSDGQAIRNYTDEYHYDETGNFIWLRHHEGKMPDPAEGTGFGQVLWRKDYTYGEPSRLEKNKPNNRLTSIEVNGVTEKFTYFDAQGNDANGCITSMPHLQTMDWDFNGRLRQVNLGGGGTAYYVYDAKGRRVRKVIHRANGAKQKERLNLGAYEVYREYNGENGEIPVLERESLQIMADNQRIALIETKTVDNGSTTDTTPLNIPLTRYQISNHLGSACLELDDFGTLISYEEFYPYGSTAYQSVNKTIKSAAKRYRYMGEERDEDTAFDYFGARYYAPWLGRWTSPDPASELENTNLYVFVMANPIGRIEVGGRGSKPSNQRPSSNPRIIENGPFDPNSPQSRASTGVQIRGFDKSVPVVKTPDGTITITHNFNPSSLHPEVKGTAELPAAFRGNTFLGTGSPDVAIVAIGDAGGVARYVAVEDFIYIKEVEGITPKNFYLENVVELDTCKEISQETPFAETKLGKILQKAANAIDLDIDNVEIIRNNKGGFDISGEFKPLPNDNPPPSMGGKPPTQGGPSGKPPSENAPPENAPSQSANPESALTAFKNMTAFWKTMTVLTAIGTFFQGWNLGTGVVDIQEEKTAEGVNKIVHNGVGLAVGIGGGALLLAGAGPLGLLGVGLFMGGSLMLSEKTVDAAIKGEPTPYDRVYKFFFGE